MIYPNSNQTTEFCVISLVGFVSPFTVLEDRSEKKNLNRIIFVLSRCDYKPDEKDSCGVTPFMDAVRNGHLGVAKLLLEKHQVKRSLTSQISRASITKS